MIVVKIIKTRKKRKSTTLEASNIFFTITEVCFDTKMLRNNLYLRASER